MSKYGIARYMTCDREDWIKEQLGMITLVGSQIWWTWEVQNVFKAIREGDKLAMRKCGLKALFAIGGSHEDGSRRIKFVRT